MPKDYGFERYAEFRPTAFDTNIDIDREDWYVMPVNQNRDSGCLQKSNFNSFLKGLGGEKGWVEVHRFGHWANGWFEIIIVSPTAHKTLEKAYDMASALENYPILDDEDFSELEHEEEHDSWNSYGAKDFRKRVVSELESERDAEDCEEPADPRQRWCKNSGMDVDVCCCGDCIETREEWMQSLIDKVENLDNEQLRAMADYMGMTVEHHSDGVCFGHKKVWSIQDLIEAIDDVKETAEV